VNIPVSVMELKSAKIRSALVHTVENVGNVNGVDGKAGTVDAWRDAGRGNVAVKEVKLILTIVKRKKNADHLVIKEQGANVEGVFVQIKTGENWDASYLPAVAETVEKGEEDVI